MFSLQAIVTPMGHIAIRMDEFGADLRSFLGESHDDGSECLIRTQYAQAVQAQAPSDPYLFSSDLVAPDCSQAWLGPSPTERV